MLNVFLMFVAAAWYLQWRESQTSDEACTLIKMYNTLAFLGSDTGESGCEHSECFVALIVLFVCFIRVKIQVVSPDVAELNILKFSSVLSLCLVRFFLSVS